MIVDGLFTFCSDRRVWCLVVYMPRLNFCCCLFEMMGHLYLLEKLPGMRLLMGSLFLME